MTIFGLIAFVLVDTANEMVLMIQRKSIEEIEAMQKPLENYLMVSSNAGKLLGFLFGSM
eukprot:CAMPEP_0114575590 /NCGR_PEP_ID=MMETSP0125-20121206/446_1 /TAXON_ID=485358 ORGANISM="Aristerostoma sp., Strain ATCC 50986" /NCGR_SAMPLE_ID=MMETSP0125 /ASSEMBLY_ACC=CAM_ASM_000245 /LENGTH=58 /DNA_ID=CAMNT_0001763445 /DNA_START=362 /DNA_END=538 /DNA_ORIENTATION=+